MKKNQNLVYMTRAADDDKKRTRTETAIFSPVKIETTNGSFLFWLAFMLVTHNQCQKKSRVESSKLSDFNMEPTEPQTTPEIATSSQFSSTHPFIELRVIHI